MCSIMMYNMIDKTIFMCQNIDCSEHVYCNTECLFETMHKYYDKNDVATCNTSGFDA